MGVTGQVGRGGGRGGGGGGGEGEGGGVGGRGNSGRGGNPVAKHKRPLSKVDEINSEPKRVIYRNQLLIKRVFLSLVAKKRLSFFVAEYQTESNVGISELEQA